MSTKLLEHARLKAAVAPELGTDQRTIEFYALAFSKTPDKQGDIIAPGAADEWLAHFYKTGIPLPISFAHAAIREASDPFAIIGHAPANPEHVWKDDHGIRVRAIIDTETNETAAQVYSLAKRGIVNDASVFFLISEGGQRTLPDGTTEITKIDEIMEAGPCLDGAEDGARILAVKTAEAEHVLEDMRAKAVDNSAWDGNRAMGQCSTAAEYRSICAGEHNAGEPDERQHWALPHHYLGQGPNAAGVRNALSRLPQTQDLRNRDAVQAHLEAHMREVNPDSAKTTDSVVVQMPIEEYERMKVGAAFSQANKGHIRDVAHSLLSLIGEAPTSSQDEHIEEATASTIEAEEPAVEEDPFLKQVREALETAQS